MVTPKKILDNEFGGETCAARRASVAVWGFMAIIRSSWTPQNLAFYLFPDPLG
jgi:hypothetical protein